MGTGLFEPWERENEIFFGFPRVPSPAPGRLDLERFWESNIKPARRSSGPSRGRGACPIPGGSWGFGARCHSVPELEEASPGFGPVQLKLLSHEPRGSGNPGSGRGRALWEGAAQSTYMRRGPADGCQEFPMRGDGGKFGQLGLANGEPREGSAPSLRPRRLAPAARVCPPRSVCVEIRSERPPRGRQFASSSRRRRRRQQPPSQAAPRRNRAQGNYPAPPVQPSPARPDSLPTPGQPLPPGEKVEEEIQSLARAHHHGPL